MVSLEFEKKNLDYFVEGAGIRLPKSKESVKHPLLPPSMQQVLMQEV